MMVRSDLKLPITAVIAVLATVTIIELCHFERGYWAILTCLLVVTSAWGEVIMRAWQRFAMTAIGCAVGTGLFAIVGDHSTISLSLFVIASGMVAFYRTKSNAISMFWVGLLVVALFGTIMPWTVKLLEVRIFETFVGCVIAILVCRFVFPTRLNNQFPTMLAATLNHAKAIISLLESEDCQSAQHELVLLAGEIDALQATAKSASYEHFFSSRQRRRYSVQAMLLSLTHLYLSQLVEHVQELPENPLQRRFQKLSGESMAHLKRALTQTLKALNDPTQKPSPLWKTRHETALRECFHRARESGRYHADDFMLISALFYHANRLEEVWQALVTDR